MDLKDKKCIPCHSYVPPLSMEEKRHFLGGLSPEWKLTENDSRIRKNFKFKNWKKAFEFASAVSVIAESEKHHPELCLGWGHCDVEIWTHNNNNLVENDFILAAKIDEAFLKLHPAGEA
jgi:4a-hydroxytetrahydrobiopterin dehydratase